jgi:N-acyl-D-amino-acid deacylase
MSNILIRGGEIVDGTGKKRFRGDIAIEGTTITHISNLENTIKADRVIDAKNKMVSPGFIDLHSHAEMALPLQDHATILKPLVMQGVTTFVGGNCGFSNCFIPDKNNQDVMVYLENLSGQPQQGNITWSTPAEFFDQMESRGLLLNMATLVGHGSLRIAASGLKTRLLYPDEQKRMNTFLEQAMEMGCLGMSTGLQYFPGLQSDAEELDTLGGILKKYDGIFTSHLRSYAHTLDLAIDEVCDVGLKNDIPIQISHLYWQPYSKMFSGLARKMIHLGSFLYNRLSIPIPVEKGIVPKLKLIESWRQKGVDVRFDQLPTSQGFTELMAFLPPYVSEGTKANALERLQDKSFRRKVLYDIENTEPDWPHRDGATWSFNYIKITGWDGLRVMAVESPENQWMEGKTFPEIGAELNKDPIDAICDLLIEENARVMVFHTPSFPDDPFAFRSLREVFKHKLCVPATDTILRPVGRPSHVFYDCFPKFIEHFVKKEKLIPIEEAIQKSTSVPAEIMKIKNRGVLQKGNYADILIFDLDRLGTSATFYDPTVHPSGIEHVLINGTPVVSGGEYQEGILPGSAIRKT